MLVKDDGNIYIYGNHSDDVLGGMMGKVVALSKKHDDWWMISVKLPKKLGIGESFLFLGW